MKGILFMIVTTILLFGLMIGVNLHGAWGDVIGFGSLVGLIAFWAFCARDDSKRSDGSERAELTAGSPPDRWL